MRKANSRIIKRCSVLILALITVCLAACSGGGSSDLKIKALAETINSGNGFHMKYYDVVDGRQVEYPVEFFIEGDKMYVDLYIDGIEVIAIMDDSNVVVRDFSTDSVETDALSGDWKTVKDGLSVYSDLFEQILSLKDSRYTTGTTTFDGMDYDTETLENDGNTTSFAFNDAGDLTYWTYSEGGATTTLKIAEISGEVPEGQFDTAKLTPGSPSGRGSTGTSSTGTSSSDTQLVESTEAGFSFETEKSATVNVNGNYVDVYLNGSGIPYFNCYAMVKTSGSTADKQIDGIIEAVIKRQQNKLTGEPEKVTIYVNGESVPGIKYSYSTDDGTDVVCAENYLVWGTGENYYSWGTAYMKGDNVTPAELQAAMSSFRETR